MASSATLFIADTHALIWLWSDPQRLGSDARAAFRAAATGTAQVIVPTLVLIEIQYKEDRGGPNGFASGTAAQARSFLVSTPGFALVPLDLAVADAVPKVPRAAVPDLPDRVISATAMAHGATLITKDGKITAWGGVPIVW